MRERTYHDPLHGAIRLETAEPAEALAIALIDTAKRWMPVWDA